MKVNSGGLQGFDSPNPVYLRFNKPIGVQWVFLIQNSEPDRSFNFLQIIHHRLVIHFINVGYNITYLFIRFEILAKDIDVMSRKNLIYFGQDSGYIMVNMN